MWTFRPAAQQGAQQWAVGCGFGISRWVGVASAVWVGGTDSFRPRFAVVQHVVSKTERVHHSGMFP